MLGVVVSLVASVVSVLVVPPGHAVPWVDGAKLHGADLHHNDSDQTGRGDEDQALVHVDCFGRDLTVDCTVSKR